VRLKPPTWSVPLAGRVLAWTVRQVRALLVLQADALAGMSGDDLAADGGGAA
jgi:hypothetical protein